MQNVGNYARNLQNTVKTVWTRSAKAEYRRSTGYCGIRFRPPHPPVARASSWSGPEP